MNQLVNYTGPGNPFQPYGLMQAANQFGKIKKGTNDALKAIKLDSASREAFKDRMQDEMSLTNIKTKLQTPEAIGTIANVAGTLGNAMQLGAKSYDGISRPGYTFNGMSMGAGAGAKLGSMLAPGVGTLIGGAVGAIAGSAFDVGKFVKGNKQYKKDMYIGQRMNKMNQYDLAKMDYTGLGM